MSALDTQVAGNHYKKMKIQPVEFITANNIGFLEGCIIKRVCRWRDKDGLQDLEKIKHEVDLLIELNKDFDITKAALNDVEEFIKAGMSKAIEGTVLPAAATTETLVDWLVHPGITPDLAPSTAIEVEYTSGKRAAGTIDSFRWGLPRFPGERYIFKYRVL